MAIITRLMPFWKTTWTNTCLRTFPQLFRWFEQFFKPIPSSIKPSPPLSSANPSSSSPAVPTPVILKKEQNMNLTQVARLVTQLSTKPRTPAIKFLGPRSPKPNFDPKKYPINVQASSSSSSSMSSPAKISSIGKVGTTPRGSGIDEMQLPLRYRRRPIDAEEIAAINNGGAYGL